jgi:hypothetical protein
MDKLALVVGEKSPVSNASSASMAVTVPQRMPARGPGNEQSVPAPESGSARALSEYRLVREIARGGMGQVYFSEEARQGMAFVH